MNQGLRAYQRYVAIAERLRPSANFGRYGLAFALTGLVLALRVALQPLIGSDAPYFLFVVSVVGTAGLSGFGPGVCATLLGALAGHVFFVEPYGSLAIANPFDIVRTASFLTFGVFISKVLELGRMYRVYSTDYAASLQDSERRLRLLVEGISDSALLMLDPDGKVASWNSGAERLLGYRGDAIIGRHVGQLYGADAAAQADAARQLETTAATEHTAAQGWRQHRDGSRLWADTSLTALRDDFGQLRGFAVLIRDRTERERQRAAIAGLNQALQQRVEELETLLNVLPVGIALADDPECRRIRGNAALTTLLELPQDANTSLAAPTIERPQFALFRNGRALTPAELPMQYAAAHNVSLASQELDLVLPDGRRRAVLAYATPLRDAHGAVRGAVGAFLDITGLKQAEAALRASEARLGGLIATAMDAIVSVDEQQRIVVFNAAAETMFGYPASAVLGKPLARLLPEASRSAHQAAIPAFGATGATSRSMHTLQPLQGLRADGTVFPVEATVSQIGAEGDKLYTAIIRDVTQRQQAEAERGALLHTEQAARQLAEDAVQLREVFLSIAAHELKTPLTALLGFTHVLGRRLGETALGDRERRALQGVEEQGDRLRKLIDTLLDLSRIQRGALDLELQPVDLSALVARVASQVGATLEAHTLHLQGGAEPLTMQGDEVRLEQVFQNLLQNAVKYSPGGGPILVRQQRQGSTAVIAVTDQGIGIPEAAQRRLFSQFFRANNVDPRRISGLGLGLYLVSEIVQAHGGTIAVSSREGLGSTFTVRLPLDERAIPQPQPGA